MTETYNFEKDIQIALIAAQAGDEGALHELTYMGRPPARKRGRGTRIRAFNDFAGWTGGGGITSITKTDTASDRVRGAHCATATWNTITNQPILTLTSISPTIDMTNAHLRVWLWCDRPKTPTKLELLISHNNATNFRTIEYQSTQGQQLLVPSVWSALDIPINFNYSTGGAGDATLNAINYIRFRASQTDAGLTTFKVGGVEVVSNGGSEFPNGVLTFRFDDGLISLAAAERILSKYGYSGSAFVIPDRMGLDEGDWSQYADAKTLRRLQDYAGWDICHHDQDHYSTRSVPGLRVRVKRYQSLLRSLGFNAWHHTAYPGGEFSYRSDTGEEVGGAILDECRNLFTTASTVFEKHPAFVDPWDAHKLPVFLLGSTDTTADVQTWMDGVKAGKLWGILVGHKLVTSGATGNDWLESDFDTVVAYAAAQGIAVRTFTEMMG